jgi:hypothetical protein
VMPGATASMVCWSARAQLGPLSAHGTCTVSGSPRDAKVPVPTITSNAAVAGRTVGIRGGYETCGAAGRGLRNSKTATDA